MITLALDNATWDLTLDVDGNIAVAAGPAAIAQDVASATRTFLGEEWYDVTFGVPYLQQILGQAPPLQFVKLQLIAAAMTVPNVVSVKCFLTGPGRDRTLGGQLQITDNLGNLIVLNAFTLGDLWYVSGVSQF